MSSQRESLKRTAEDEIHPVNRKRAALLNAVSKEKDIEFKKREYMCEHEIKLADFKKEEQQRSFDVWDKVCDLTENLACIYLRVVKANEAKVIDYVRLDKGTHDLTLICDRLKGTPYMATRFWTPVDAWKELVEKDIHVIAEDGSVKGTEFVLDMDAFLAKYPSQSDEKEENNQKK